MIAPDLAGLAVPVNDLNLLEGNPRRGDVDAVARSLERFGQRKPIVVRRSDRQVLAGNHTLQAARHLGWPDIAVVWVDDDEAMARAFALADNRTAELGGYDDAALAEMVAAVQGADPELLAATGWSADDVAELLGSVQELPAAGPEDLGTTTEPPADPITKPGDVWLLGPHRIICGDSRDHETVTRLLDGQQINVAFTSPPYASQRTYDESSGFKPIPPAEYVGWFEDVQANVRAHLAEDGSWFVNIKEHCEDGQRHLYVKDLTIAHVRRWGWRFIDEFAWTREGVPGRWGNRFKNGWEPVFHFSANGGIKFRPDNVAHESDRVFSYSDDNRTSKTGFVSPTGQQMEQGMALPPNVLKIAADKSMSQAHEAAFPAALPAWFIRAYSDPSDAVFDPFMGSGTTLIAAHQENRVAYGTEISPAYCDVICTRWQNTAGVKPVLASTGEPHDFTGGDDGAAHRATS